MDIEAWKAATAGSRARRPGSRSKQPKPADSEAEGVSPAEHAKTDSTRPAAADNEAGYEAEGSASAADPSADDDLKS
jgi:hypothetical protein